MVLESVRASCSLQAAIGLYSATQFRSTRCSEADLSGQEATEWPTVHESHVVITNSAKGLWWLEVVSLMMELCPYVMDFCFGANTRAVCWPPAGCWCYRQDSAVLRGNHSYSQGKMCESPMSNEDRSTPQVWGNGSNSLVPRYAESAPIRVESQQCSQLQPEHHQEGLITQHHCSPFWSLSLNCFWVDVKELHFSQVSRWC